MDRALLATLAILAAAAGLEGVFAGSGVRQYLRSLRQPRWGPPFAIWVAIGILYYILFGTILYRLLRIEDGQSVLVPITLVLLILLFNALWNFLFFRLRSLKASFRANFPYGLTVVALFLCLLRLDPLGALLLVPYLFYLMFALAWTSALLRLNPHDPAQER